MGRVVGISNAGVFLMKRKKGQAIPIAPLQPSTLAAFRPWGSRWELVVGDLPRAKIPSISRLHYLAAMNLPKLALQQGAAAGVIVVVIKGVAYLMGISALMSQWVGFGQLILVVAGMMLACNLTRKEAGGWLTFGEAFVAALVAAAVTTGIVLVMDIVLGSVIDPELGSKMLRHTMDELESSGIGALIPEEQMEKTMEDMAWALKPGGQVLSWVLGLLWWSLIALIVAAVTKRKDPKAF
jgi:hypothetical protein